MGNGLGQQAVLNPLHHANTLCAAYCASHEPPQHAQIKLMLPSPFFDPQRVSTYEFKEEKRVYDVVEEADYAKLVAKRRNEGGGYTSPYPCSAVHHAACQIPAAAAL